MSDDEENPRIALKMACQGMEEITVGTGALDREELDELEERANIAIEMIKKLRTALDTEVVK